jgi:hypothetical protein
MAGSLRYFRYIADDNSTWAVLLDESNTESIQAASAVGNDLKYKLPGNVRPRCAFFANADNRIRRKIVVLTKGAFETLGPSAEITDQVSGQTLRITRKVGEIVKLPTQADTGLNDGDAPD